MLMNTKNTKNHTRPEAGFVAIIVASLIMIILSLITIGFTRIMQREQRQTLDRQLSRQALYAAESGINDIYGALQANPNLPAEKTDCDVENPLSNGQPNPAIDAGSLSSDGNIAYTCALYDKTPTELVYSLNTSESRVTELKTDSGNPFSTMRFRWANEQGNNAIDSLPNCGPDAGNFPASRSGVVPLIRIDITNTSTLSRDALINSTDYLYLAPCQGGSATTYAYSPASSPGKVIGVSCVAGQELPCDITITGFSSNAYAGRFRSVYDSARLVISATEITPTGGIETVEFRQAQTSIDVTAKATDVVRRLRVAIPVAGVNSPPEAVFQAFDGVCKLLAVDASIPAAPRVIDSCVYP